MWSSLRRRYALVRWHRRARRKHRVPLYVGDVLRLLARIEEAGTAAAVLRWPEDVPRTRQAEQSKRGDVDLLIDGDGLESVLALATEQPGLVRLDLHSTTGLRGTTFGGIPHYPPVRAEQMLNDRERCDHGFHVLGPTTYFRSLAYHLVYHKGLETGIPSGCQLAGNPNPKRPYARLLADIADRAGVRLAEPISLVSIDEHLRDCGWNAPLDLLSRWPKPTAWHEWLLAREREALAPWAVRLPHLLVFFIRDDAAACGLTVPICGMLEKKLEILDVCDLSDQQAARVMERVRGGDWIEHRHTTLVRPRTAVVCYDRNANFHSPDRPVPTSRRVMMASSAVTPVNKFKHEIRARINEVRLATEPSAGRDRSPLRLHAIHGSDNAYEAQHMLRAVFGDDCERRNAGYLVRLSQAQKLSAEARCGAGRLNAAG